ncbi:class I SAM-dependent methyltransferase [Sorangium sp. So ce1335]|uniref:class I SAM-dependent methyltransferase n=1 Tax=Sorangium sp. So ce1335 TaxID=3133335 RepID=UPI003F5F7370
MIDASIFRDNGFSSFRHMEMEHARIVSFLEPLLSQGATVLDLGCGNGELLRKITECEATVTPFGVDLGPEKIDRAKETFPGRRGNFVAADLFCYPALEARAFDVVLLMPGRLLDVSTQVAAGFRDWLEGHCTDLILYAYDDWMARYRTLDALARECGFPGLSRCDGNVGSLSFRPSTTRMGHHESRCSQCGA